MPWYKQTTSGLVLSMLLLLGACTGKPDNVEPVQNFELDNYLGEWYEIARLPHSFEEGLSHVTAQYSPRDDGGISVINRGYNAESGEWEQAEGKAYFVEASNVGHLKVSFFGPFYASYVIFALDESYDYAMVTGPDKDYLWILSRTPTLRGETVNALVAQAAQKGYPTDSLIYVEQKNRPQ
ncbi:lipocalin family protein [Alteromonas sp. H39]|uniref:lipocalin family protein n=1 Tax=Alteromonas sp. H39 TaxID=3389876 RepID=UPI0039E0CFD9